MAAEHVRTTIVFPADVAARLRELVPSGRRSEFVADAVDERLRGMQFSQACRHTSGAWKDEDHPELQTFDDLRQYMRELRGPDHSPTQDVVLQHPLPRTQSTGHTAT